jgi:hypothetical protein
MVAGMKKMHVAAGIDEDLILLIDVTLSSPHAYYG